MYSTHYKLNSFQNIVIFERHIFICFFRQLGRPTMMKEKGLLVTKSCKRKFRGKKKLQLSGGNNVKWRVSN